MGIIERIEEKVDRILELLDNVPIEPPIEPPSDVINIIDYFIIGESDYTQATVRAGDYLNSIGGGTLIFPDGSYKIRPSVIKVSKNTKWTGEGLARIYTEETVLYNVLISTTGSNDATFENLIFDQRGDSDLLPTKEPYMGAIAIHIYNTDKFDIHSCTFYGYGICPVLCEGNLGTEYAKFYNNEMYWQRKVDVNYDVSVAHIEAKTAEVYDNYVEAIETDFVTFRAATALEIHSPNGYITNNTSINCDVGPLNVPWGNSWTNVDLDYIGAMLVNKNILINSVRGIEFWTGLTEKSLCNVTVEGNQIGLYLTKNNYSVPTSGVNFFKGNSKESTIENLVIRNNIIDFTFNKTDFPSFDYVMARYEGTVFSGDTGIFNLNIASTTKNVEIYDNKVTGFPYSFFNLYRRDSEGGTKVHENISFHDNEAINCAYAYPYQKLSQAIFSLGCAKDVSIINNIIRNPDTTLIQQKEELDYLTNLVFDNDFGVVEEPVILPTEKVYNNVLGAWSNKRQMYVYGFEQCTLGDVIQTPTDEVVTISKEVTGPWVTVSKDITKWAGTKPIICVGVI